MNSKIIEFLEQSNLIEDVGPAGLQDSIKAYNYIMQVNGQLTNKHILKTHKILLRTLSPKIAGKYRDCSVQVGNYLAPSPEKIQENMEKFLELVNSKRGRYNPKEKANYCKTVHINFEKAHPFEDGNGRVGRLILNWQREQMGLPILIVKNSEKYDYYNWFL